MKMAKHFFLKLAKADSLTDKARTVKMLEPGTVLHSEGVTAIRAGLANVGRSDPFWAARAANLLRGGVLNLEDVAVGGGI